MITSIKFKQSDMDRITQKIKKLESNVMDIKKLYFVIEHYARAYRHGVVKAIGTVAASTDMEGGSRTYPVISFMDLSASPVGGWAPLSPQAVNSKIKRGGRVTFWYQTGAVFDAVSGAALVGSYSTNRTATVFAGIDRARDAEAYKHAILTEFGGVNEKNKRVPARALFTIANELFKTKRNEIEKAVMTAVLEGVNWGGAK